MTICYVVKSYNALAKSCPCWKFKKAFLWSASTLHFHASLYGSSKDKVYIIKVIVLLNTRDFRKRFRDLAIRFFYDAPVHMLSAKIFVFRSFWLAPTLHYKYTNHTNQNILIQNFSRLRCTHEYTLEKPLTKLLIQQHEKNESAFFRRFQSSTCPNMHFVNFWPVELWCFFETSAQAQGGAHFYKHLHQLSNQKEPTAVTSLWERVDTIFNANNRRWEYEMWMQLYILTSVKLLESLLRVFCLVVLYYTGLWKHLCDLNLWGGFCLTIDYIMGRAEERTRH